MTLAERRPGGTTDDLPQQLVNPASLQMIVTGQLVCPQEDRGVKTCAGWVEVADGRIVGVSGEGIHPNLDLGDEDCVVFPGFVDCHLHLPQFGVVGVHGIPLLEWLEEAVFPAEAKWSDAQYARGVTAGVIQQLFSFGTTAIFAFGTVHEDAVNAALEECLARRLRARVGHVLMDQQCPNYLSRDVAEQLRAAEHLVRKWPDATDGPSPLVAATLAPRFAVSCSPRLLAGAGRIASSTGSFVQTHLAETEAEVAVVSDLYPTSQDYTAVYEEAGLLGPRSLLAHGIWLSGRERESIRSHGVMIAHCPVANSFLRSGEMDREEYLRSGMKITLGTDIGGGYHRSMVRVAQEMIATAAALRTKPASSEEAWWQITRGNADTVGWSNVGRINVGAEASLVVVRPDLRWREYPDPLGALLFGWDDRWIRATVSVGEVVHRG